MEITIRNAKNEDAQAIYFLNKEALGYDYGFEKTKIRVQHILEKDHDIIMVAELGETVAGYIHLADYDCTYEEPLKNILAIAVSKDSRGYGIGKILLKAAEICAENEGCRGIRLVSGYDRRQAHAFYLSQGI